MKRLFYLLMIYLNVQLVAAQVATQSIEMSNEHWIVPEGAEFERFDNRETLVLTSGRASVKNEKFTNGTIEVDVYANSIRSFAGITFRKQEDNMEEVYMRMHKSSQADAVQYTPIFNNESNWQLFREYQAQVTFKKEGWNQLRIEINHHTATVFVNDEQVLMIDHLRTEQGSGEIGLFALFTNRFSNFKVTHRQPKGVPEQGESQTPEADAITQWKITEAKPYQEGVLNFNEFSNEKYSTVQTEPSGLLVISKYLRKTISGNFEENEEDYTIATTTYEAKSEETRLFSFDYSDRIIIYLNGKPVFRGNNAFRTKGVQYMGHVDINTQQLFLNLKKGVNTIHCVVIDKANGWGLMAKWGERSSQ